MKTDPIYDIILSVLTGESTEKECSILTAWLDESPDNRKKYEELRRIHTISKITKKKPSFNIEAGWRKVYPQTIGRRKTPRLRTIIRYAAIITVFLTIGTYFIIKPGEQYNIITVDGLNRPVIHLDNGEQIILGQKEVSAERPGIIIKSGNGTPVVYETSAHGTSPKNKNIKNKLIVPKGHTVQVILCDGTDIRLNSESRLIFPDSFSEDKRKVELLGEAYFDVAGDKTKPFIVLAGEMNVEVLGTSFNISAYQDDKTITATLVEGIVQVSAGNDKSVTLTPSEQFSYNKTDKHTTVEKVDVNLYASWINGEYIFKNACLEDIMTKLQRWHDFSVNYQDEQLKKLRFSMTIDCDTPADELIELINFTTEIKITRTGNTINIRKEES